MSDPCPCVTTIQSASVVVDHAHDPLTLAWKLPPACGTSCAIGLMASAHDTAVGEPGTAEVLPHAATHTARQETSAAHLRVMIAPAVSNGSRRQTEPAGLGGEEPDGAGRDDQRACGR